MSNVITYSNEAKNYFHFIIEGFGGVLSIDDNGTYRLQREDDKWANWNCHGTEVPASTFDAKADEEFIKGVEELFNQKMPHQDSLVWAVAGSSFTYKNLVFKEGDYILFNLSIDSIIGRAEPCNEAGGHIIVYYITDNGISKEWVIYAESDVLSDIKAHWDNLIWLEESQDDEDFEFENEDEIFDEEIED